MGQMDDSKGPNRQWIPFQLLGSYTRAIAICVSVRTYTACKITTDRLGNYAFDRARTVSPDSYPNRLQSNILAIVLSDDRFSPRLTRKRKSSKRCVTRRLLLSLATACLAFKSPKDGKNGLLQSPTPGNFNTLVRPIVIETQSRA